MEKLRWFNQQPMKMLCLKQIVVMVKDQNVIEEILKEGVVGYNLGTVNIACAATALAQERMQP